MSGRIPAYTDLENQNGLKKQDFALTIPLKSEKIKRSPWAAESCNHHENELWPQIINFSLATRKLELEIV